MKQFAYARRVWGAKGTDKKNIALDVGYSQSTASKAVEKIESTKGFNNAMTKLACESNNMALAVLSEFKARGLNDFSNKDLVGALNAIGNAWSRFNQVDIENAKGRGKKEGNKLRAIVIHEAEKGEAPAATYTVKPQEEGPDLNNLGF
jgi:hypothetical protein